MTRDIIAVLVGQFVLFFMGLCLYMRASKAADKSEDRADRAEKDSDRAAREAAKAELARDPANIEKMKADILMFCEKAAQSVETSRKYASGEMCLALLEANRLGMVPPARKTEFDALMVKLRSVAGHFADPR